MNKKNQQTVQTLQATSLPTAASRTDVASSVSYTAPQIEVIDIEVSQNILAGSPGGDEPINPF